MYLEKDNVKQIVIAGALACMMLSGQQVVSQQSIPDAPKPQAVPGFGSVAPGQGTTPTSNGDSSTSQGAATANPADPNAPPSKLGSSAPQTQQPGGKPTDEEQAPTIPSTGQGGKVYTLPPVTVNYVQIPFSVKDSKNTQVPGIDWSEVQVFENGVRQHLSFWTVDPYPLSVALVIDQGVTHDTMTKINNALAALQGAFSPYDEVAIFTYNGNFPQEQTDFTAAQSARLGAVLEQSKGKGNDPIMGLDGPLAQTTNINNQQFDPNTAPVRNSTGMSFNAPKEYHPLNDAILAAAVATTKTGRDRRRVVYVISDGKEYGSQAKERDVIKYLQMHEVSVFATLVGDSAVPGEGFLDRVHLPLQMRDDVLPRYTFATGGLVDREFRTGGIERSFAHLTEEVRDQYTAGYYSHEPFIDGKYRRVEVRVLRPNLNVVAKEGYYPSAMQSGQGAAPAPATTAAPR